MNKLTITELDQIVKASADANRIRILALLDDKKMCVCEMAFVLGITQPSVSRHLKKLKAAGFIGSENQGLWTNYFLSPQNLYARDFIKNLSVWLVTDSLLLTDKKKAHAVDRTKLCCASACKP